MTGSDLDAPPTVFVFSGSTIAEAAQDAVDHMARSFLTRPLLLPSSLDREDPLVHAIQRGIRDRERSSTMAVSELPLRLATSVFSAKRSEWRAAPLPLPDGPDRDVLLPRRFLAGDAVLYVTHVNAVAQTGPFQLDLLARYVHPRQRIRQVVDRDRAGLAAEINLAMQPGWGVIGCDVPPGVVAITRDLIAAELVALCLAERFFDRQTEFSSPWEDRVVQRATELELGARTPGDIRIGIVREPVRSHGESGTRRSVHHIVQLIEERIGMVPKGEAESAEDSRPVPTG